MDTKRLGVRAAVVDGAIIPGDVEIADEQIMSVGCRPAGATGLAVPGLIDLQVNGFGGVDFLNTDVEGFEVAGAALASYGVTAYQPTLVTSPRATVLTALDQARKAADLSTGPRILGVHLEGPFIATPWKGAHDERYIVPPDIDYARELCDAGPVTYMTIAPEQPGADALLDWLLERGITVAIGHSDADAAAAHAAFNRGARAVTHMHNAQRRFSAREPAISGVAMTRDDVFVEIIADLVHLAPETVGIAWRCARGRLVLVTDSIAAAGAAAGEYKLGDRTIYVDDSAARLADGTLAGSILTMDRAVRNLVGVGAPLTEAVAAASATPARVIGRQDLGTLRPRSVADVAVLDDNLRAVKTIVAGREIWAA